MGKRTELREPKYRCGRCGRTFASQEDLDEHRRQERRRKNRRKKG